MLCTRNKAFESLRITVRHRLSKKCAHTFELTFLIGEAKGHKATPLLRLIQIGHKKRPDLAVWMFHRPHVTAIFST